MRINHRKDLLAVVTLLTLTAAIAFANYFWLLMNQRPPMDDEAVHLLSALEYFRILAHPSADMIGRLLTVDKLYPPFFPLLAACGARLFGVFGTLPFCMANIFFLAVTFFSLYGIGLKMGDRRLGVLASCLLTLYPMFFHLSRMFMLEVALVGTVTLTMMLLLYSQGFSRTLWSILAGISLGFGMLTKQPYVVFIAGPSLFGLAGSWKNLDREQKHQRVANVCLFVAIGIAIASPWYLAGGGGEFLLIKNAFINKDTVVFSISDSPLGALFFYVKTMLQEQMRWFFFGIFVLAVLPNIKKMAASPFLLVWLAVPFAIFPFFPNKFYYYTLPCLPAAALITAHGVLSVKKTALRWLIICILLLGGIGQYLSLSYTSPFAHSKILRFAHYSPLRGNYQIQTLLKRISEGAKVAEPVIAVTRFDPNSFPRRTGSEIGDNYALVNWNTLRYLAALASRSWTMTEAYDLEREAYKAKPNFIVSHDTLEKLNFPASLSSLYRLTDIFVMPDMSRGFLYILKATSVADRKEVIVHQNDPEERLESGPLCLALAENTWKIFWKGREITKGLAVYTSFRSFNTWIDSRQCLWRILSLDKNHLGARSLFPLPLPVQDWEFILKGNRIYWTVRIFAPFFASWEQSQANVMLTDAYRRWVTARESGDFPHPSDKNYGQNWQSLAIIKPFSTECVGTEQVSDSLPAVTFYSFRPGPGRTGMVADAHGQFCGRVLQYIVRYSRRHYLWPGKYEYFRGCIVIGDRPANEKELETAAPWNG